MGKQELPEPYRWTAQGLDEALLMAFQETIVQLERSSRTYKTRQAVDDARGNKTKKERLDYSIYRALDGKTFRYLHKPYLRFLFEEKFRKVERWAAHSSTNEFISEADLESFNRKQENLWVTFCAFIEQRNPTPPALPRRVGPQQARNQLRMPSKALLTEFHCCGRKKSYAFQKDADAHLRKIDPGMVSYACVFCSGWHVGHEAKRGKDYNRFPKYDDSYKETWVRRGMLERASTFLKEKNLLDNWK